MRRQASGFSPTHLLRSGLRPKTWPMRLHFALLTGLALSACTQFPELDDAVSKDVAAAPYPEFLPTAQFSGTAPAPRLSADDEAALIARAARLSARAAALRRPVLSRANAATLANATR